MKVPSAHHLNYMWLECQIVCDYSYTIRHVILDKGEHFERLEYDAIRYICKYLW